MRIVRTIACCLAAAAVAAVASAGAGAREQALPAKQIESIVGEKGSESSGALSMSPVLKLNVHLNGVKIDPSFQLGSDLDFQAERNGEAFFPDFDMVGTEINPVLSTMRAQGWEVGCLYNQETSESPQLYFSHNFKTGNPYELAREIRRGLDRMNVVH